MDYMNRNSKLDELNKFFVFEYGLKIYKYLDANSYGNLMITSKKYYLLLSNNYIIDYFKCIQPSLSNKKLIIDIWTYLKNKKTNNNQYILENNLNNSIELPEKLILNNISQRNEIHSNELNYNILIESTFTDNIKSNNMNNCEISVSLNPNKNQSINSNSPNINNKQLQANNNNNLYKPLSCDIPYKKSNELKCMYIII